MSSSPVHIHPRSCSRSPDPPDTTGGPFLHSRVSLKRSATLMRLPPFRRWQPSIGRWRMRASAPLNSESRFFPRKTGVENQGGSSVARGMPRLDSGESTGGLFWFSRLRQRGASRAHPWLFLSHGEMQNFRPPPATRLLGAPLEAE
jgi:hypothetical protein